MEESTLWQIFSGLCLIIGYLIKALVNALKNKDDSKIYICPLDKSGIKGDMLRITQDLDKAENKLNNITSITEYNKKFIENIHEHYTRISDALSTLVLLSKQNIEQNKEQNKLLEKISKNGH